MTGSQKLTFDELIRHWAQEKPDQVALEQEGDALTFAQLDERSRRIVAIEFDDGGTVSNVEEYDLADGRNVNLVGRETPTRGRELTILEQLFGNIGRLPTEQLGGDRNLPGGAGGPRPDGS